MSRTTGWPPGLLQDDSRELSSWFSSRPGARRLVDLRCAEIRALTAARDRARLAGLGTPSGSYRDDPHGPHFGQHLPG